MYTEIVFLFRYPFKNWVCRLVPEIFVGVTPSRTLENALLQDENLFVFTIDFHTEEKLISQPSFIKFLRFVTKKSRKVDDSHISQSSEECVHGKIFSVTCAPGLFDFSLLFSPS